MLHGDSVCLDPEHLTQVVEMLLKYKHYSDAVHGGDEAQRASENRYRYDDYGISSNSGRKSKLNRTGVDKSDDASITD